MVQESIIHWAFNVSMLDDKTRRKSIYDTKSLKTSEMGGHPKHLHANTPHISVIARKVLPVVLFVLGSSVRQTKRQHFPVAFMCSLLKRD